MENQNYVNNIKNLGFITLLTRQKQQYIAMSAPSVSYVLRFRQMVFWSYHDPAEHANLVFYLKGHRVADCWFVTNWFTFEAPQSEHYADCQADER